MYKIILLLALFISSSANSSIYQWSLLDVTAPYGGGEAQLLELNGKFILIDTGISAYSSKLIKHIKSKTNVIDRVFISHPHYDHYQNIAAISDAVKINNLHYHPVPTRFTDFAYIPEDWQTALNHVKSTGTKLITEKEGNIYIYGDASIRTLHLARTGRTVNDFSMIQVLRVYRTKVLLTGDLDHTVGLEIVPKVANYDILKAPHHGVNTIPPVEFFRSVNPSVIVISGEPALLSPHPISSLTQGYIKESGIDQYNVAIDGIITTRFMNNGYTINGKLYENKPIDMAPIISYLIH